MIQNIFRYYYMPRRSETIVPGAADLGPRQRRNLSIPCWGVQQASAPGVPHNAEHHTLEAPVNCSESIAGSWWPDSAGPAPIKSLAIADHKSCWLSLSFRKPKPVYVAWLLPRRNPRKAVLLWMGSPKSESPRQGRPEERCAPGPTVPQAGCDREAAPLCQRRRAAARCATKLSRGPTLCLQSPGHYATRCGSVRQQPQRQRSGSSHAVPAPGGHTASAVASGCCLAQQPAGVRGPAAPGFLPMSIATGLAACRAGCSPLRYSVSLTVGCLGPTMLPLSTECQQPAALHAPSRPAPPQPAPSSSPGHRTAQQQRRRPITYFPAFKNRTVELEYQAQLGPVQVGMGWHKLRRHLRFAARSRPLLEPCTGSEGG